MEIWIHIYSILMLVLGIYSLLNIIINLLYFRHLNKAETREDGPLISVVVPARNEEKNIGNLLESLIAQDYRKIEILVINDQSTDGTEAIIREYAEKDSRIHCFSTEAGKILHSNGKINALLQLIPHAKGEYILATDADTMHSKNCISHAYSVMKEHHLDIISGFPKELCSSYFGSLCMSAMMLTYVFIPHWFVYRFPIPAATFAIGQFIMMRKKAYDETGGYTKIKGYMDDVGIARLFVRNRKNFAFISISKYVACYMYTNASEAFRGIERSIAGIFPPKAISFIPILCLVTILVHIALSPLASILAAFTAPGNIAAMMITGSVLFIIAWYTGCKSAKWRKRVSISCSFTLLIIIAMYLHGFFRSVTGKGFEWKGRIIH